jgi:hypothetical protein
MADQEIDETLAEEVVETDDIEVELDDEETPVETEEVELDDNGEPVEKKAEVPAWQSTGEEEGEEFPDVPARHHIIMKQKLKGRVQKRDDEIETLKQKIANLESSRTVTTTDLPAKPKPEDFDTDAEHEAALAKWDDQRQDARWAAQQEKEKKAAALRQHNAAIAKDVDAHYERTAELVKSSGMKAENFKEADTTVREMVEAILPGQGDNITDQIISVLGEGSEKVMFYIGRNKTAKLEFQSLLAEDRTGNKSLVYLGQQKERLNNPKKLRSNAVKPATDVKGDLATSQKGAAMKKKYQAAHKKGSTQVAYNLKKDARAAGVDVSSW